MADWFWDNDPFESIIEEFFGRGRYAGGRREHIIRGEDDERVIDVIEDENHAYLIFELPGYEEGDVSISVKGKTLEISLSKKNTEGMKEYLAQKLSSGLKYTRTLPEQLNSRDYEYTFKNGILEIKFNKGKK